MARILLIGLARVCAVFVSPASAAAFAYGDLRRQLPVAEASTTRGEALVELSGMKRSAASTSLIWGAVNAHAPDLGRPQVEFRVSTTPAVRVRTAPGMPASFTGPVPFGVSTSPRLLRVVVDLQGARRLLLGAAARQRLAPMRRPRPVSSLEDRLELPSRMSRTQPRRRLASARRRVVSRKKTPCTCPGRRRAGATPASSTSLTRSIRLRRLAATPPSARTSKNGAFCYSFVAQVPPGYPSSRAAPATASGTG